jgi:hypothetical protein
VPDFRINADKTGWQIKTAVKNKEEHNDNLYL